MTDNTLFSRIILMARIELIIRLSCAQLSRISKYFYMNIQDSNHFLDYFYSFNQNIICLSFWYILIIEFIKGWYWSDSWGRHRFNRTYQRRTRSWATGESEKNWNIERNIPSNKRNKYTTFRRTLYTII